MKSNILTTTAMMPFPFMNSSGPESQVSVGPSPDPHCPSDTSSLRIPLTLFYALFVVLGLAGNLLALWVFLLDRSKKGSDKKGSDKKASVDVLLVNVALSDLLLVVCMAFRVWYHGVRGERWELGATMCHVVGNFFYMNMYISIVLLGLISIDRYLKISRGGVPLQRPRGLAMRCGWRTAACALIWALVLAFTLLMTLLGEETPKELNRSVLISDVAFFMGYRSPLSLLDPLSFVRHRGRCPLVLPDASSISHTSTPSGRATPTSCWWSSSGSATAAWWCATSRSPSSC